MNADCKGIMLWACALVLLTFLGCNTDVHFTSTPYLEEDFLLSPDDLSRSFYDIDRYKEVTFPFLAFFGH